MEPLWNLMAIQEGISSKRTAFGSKGSTRGHGLMDVIEYISSIKDDKGVAEIAIISGGSKILIDFSYPIAKINIGQETRRRLVFNNDGHLYSDQDPRNLIPLNDNLEGTVVTGKFKIKESFLKQYEIRKNN